MAPALLIPFAEAAGLTVAGLGAIEIGKKVKDFVDNNPEKSNKILTSIKESALMTLPGSMGLNTLFKKKAKPVEEEVKETEKVNIGSGVEEKIKEILVGEGVDLGEIDLEELSKDLQAKVMSGIAKSSTDKQKDMKEASAIIGLSGPAKETKKMADEVDNRYDGGLEEVGKAKGYDYRDFIPFRKKYYLGGLTTQGQRLSDSMSSYGFNEMEIAQALDEQQLYPESMTLGLQQEAVVPPRVQPILPINQGGDTQPTPPSSPSYGYAPSKDLSIQDIGEGTITEEEEKFYQKGQLKSGLKSLGSLLGFASNPLFFLAKKGYNMYQDNVQKGINETNRLEKEKLQRQLAEQEAIKEAARLQQIRDYGNYGESGGSYSGRGDEGATTANFSGDFATDSLSYDLKDGGLATMFVRRG